METKNGNTIFSEREMKELTKLAIKLAAPRTSEQDKLNVIISGNFRKGMNWLEMARSQFQECLLPAHFQGQGV